MVTIRGKKVYTTPKRFLVLLSIPDNVTASGIIIPPTATKETDYTGTIVVAPKNETEYSVGDFCVVSKNSGVTVHTDDAKGKYKMYDRNELLYVWTERYSEQG